MPHSKNWILLRGLARGVGHWGSFVDRMKKRYPQNHFELLDLPGNGARYKEKSPLQVSEYVKDLRAHSEFVKNGETFNILGISLGAMITVEWMREFPHEVKKAYLLCTSSSGISPFYQRFQVENYLMAPRLFMSQGNHVEWEKIILGLVTNSHERREEEMFSLMEYSKAHPMNIANILRQMVAASQYRFPNEGPGDVKLIGSYGDRLVSPECTLAIAHKWGLRPVMHPWAGHDIPLDDPQWVLEHLLKETSEN